ncbi:protein turtle homolog B-like [Centruroides sculpturatus]|uniref:protein turtle homolog B-like n=1 Tax=Centruroides sculpturatus TaxID=218467 RepID=UPI000C6D7C3F|nr:protein turtle homolog B-like [Centruroides sculpturatus]
MVAFFVLSSVLLLQVNSGFALNEPIKIISKSGKDVVLPCKKSHDDDIYLVQWHRKGNFTPIYVWFEQWAPYVDKKYEGRVELSGEASLSLKKVNKEDEGIFECHVLSLDNGETQVNTTKVILKVKDLMPMTTIITKSVPKKGKFHYKKEIVQP